MLSSTQTSERNQLVVKHLRNVKVAARRLKVSGALRDELISAGYEALVRAGNRFDPTVAVTFTTFSFRAVLGAMYDYLRDHAKEAANHVDIHSHEDALASPEFSERQLLTAQVLGALEALPLLEQSVIRLHFLEEQTLSAIGARLGMSKTKVSLHLGRALELLREQLDDGFSDWPVRQIATKRRFNEELKNTVIRRASEPGANVAQLGRDLDIPAATIRTWLYSSRRRAHRTLPLAA